MCNSCYRPDYLCTCGGFSNDSCGSGNCTEECPVTLDFKCIFYNKLGIDSNKLQGLNLPNGSTLKLIVETIDEKVKQLDILSFSLPTLRATNVINSLKQFAEAVDSKIGGLQNTLNSFTHAGYIGEIDNDPVTAANGSYWFNVPQNKLKIKVNGVVKEIVTA